MDLYVRVGQRNSALHQFELCRDLLERDLGVPPEAETEALADRIRQDRLENKSTPKTMVTVLEDTKSPRYPDDPPDETPNETIVEGPPTDTLSRRPNQTNSSNGGAERAERRLAAIVSADVAGFSRLMNVDEAGTLASLRAHRAELIDPLIAEHGGRIVKTMGDGLLLEFPSVLAAVHCCVEVQDGMEVRNAGVVGDEAIRFRIGVHLGDIVVEGGDIFGNGVNIAANLQEMAETGSVWISEVSHEQIRSNLDLYYEDQGHRQLKNISETVHAYRVHTGSQAREGDGLIARKSSGNRFRMISGSIAVGLIAVAVFGWLVFDLGGFGQNSSVCKDHLGLPVPCPIRDH